MAGKVTLKLLVDMKGQRVLFSEAGKDFVGFLFNIMSLPIGAFVRLLIKEGMVGSLGNIYERIEKLSEVYIQPFQAKEIIKHVLIPCLNQMKVKREDFHCPTISSLLNRFSVKDSGALQEKTIKIRMDEEITYQIFVLLVCQAVKLLKASSPSKTVLNDIFYGKKAHRTDGERHALRVRKTNGEKSHINRTQASATQSTFINNVQMACIKARSRAVGTERTILSPFTKEYRVLAALCGIHLFLEGCSF
ncbi:hypothetical protein CXB51_005368 [Gossypium anomalum]|uniref:Uncharacterized protein n=1 Tax=Gossypium anomalum TaxID=47600 RepID=A0A8J5Z0Y8_9ROSI|nr:hypothetical protein CXB51_005368 [Gossypium anomalum]